MHIINAANVCEALPMGVHYLLMNGQVCDSRNGRVFVSSMPVTTVYSHPHERVLFSAVRDANPVFHLMEALWMLAGRRDANFLDHFVKDFSSRYAEYGTMHGAYGFRWHDTGQLDFCVRKLKDDPNTRQCVIQMWDQFGYDDLTGNWKDRPCNLNVVLRIRKEALDIYVPCRSNDILWGAYGSNAVHFSFLQEYLAAKIGCKIGYYYQVSFDYHMYVETLHQLLIRAGNCDCLTLGSKLDDNRYPLTNLDFVDDPNTIDQEIIWLLELYENQSSTTHGLVLNYRNSFLSLTVWPMLMAHQSYKQNKIDESLEWVQRIKAEDWRIATQEWIERRVNKKR